MAVRRRPNGSWLIDIVLWREGERIRIRKTPSGIKTRHEALEVERKERQKLRAAPIMVVSSELPLFADFAKEFQETYVAVENKHSERITKAMIFARHLVPAFGKMRLDSIGARQIDAYKAKKLAEGLKPKTINNHLTILRRALSLAVEWGKLALIPKIRWLKTKRPDFDFLTFDEAERLLAGAEPEWRLMILLGLRAGLRQGEILALRWMDVDLVTGRIVVRQSVYDGVIDTPKGGREREVPMSDELVRAFREMPRGKGEFVFCRPRGTMWTKNECKAPLWRACKAAGLRRIGWHVLRHTFASHLVMCGVALKAVQELLGHATLDITLRYAHLAPEVRRDAVQLLDRARGQHVVHANATMQ